MKRQRGEGESVFERLDDALKPDGDLRSAEKPLTMKQVQERRRRERAQRLHERRGGFGEVVEPQEPPRDRASGSARLRVVREPSERREHPDIIWEDE